MKAYSQDLRECILQTVDEGKQRRANLHNHEACHTCTVLSLLAETMRLPTGDHYAVHTVSE